jgi:predicted O-methyltransferase YrrM
MKLCGQISIELPAGDYFTTADHRRRLEEILAYIRDSYPEATLALRERRERRALQLVPAEPRAATGALNRYAPD